MPSRLYLGPLPHSSTPQLLLFTGLGLVLKHDGGWHDIYPISAPYGSSINDSINPQDYTLSYYSVDVAFTIVSALGRGILMAKIDLRNVFLLGIKWLSKFLIDTCLPFGLRSAPFPTS